jgi:hypothetical protein
VKEKSKILKQFEKILNAGAGFERLFFFIMMSLMVCHIISCMWVFAAKLSDDETGLTWIGEDYKDYAEK